MIEEAIKHIFGLCSDSSTHPTLLMLLGSGFGIGTMWKYIKFKFKKQDEKVSI